MFVFRLPNPLRLWCAALFLGLLIIILPPAGVSPALAQGDPCGGTASRLIMGELAEVIVDPGQTLRLRSAPGLSAATSARLNRGEILNVVQGPICADGYPWWQLETAGGLTGWAAEGSGSVYFLEPVAPERVTPSPIPPTQTPLPTATTPPTAAPSATPAATASPTVTSSPTVTASLTITASPTVAPSATATIPPSATNTAIPPTDTPTASPVPPTITPSPTLTLTPTLTPTVPALPTAAPSATLDTQCWTAPRPRLRPGDEALVASTVQGLRLRSLPAVGTGQERLLRPGTPFTVEEGPLCNTGYYWYQVTLEDDTSGWLAEGEGPTYWIEPADAKPAALADRACLAWADSNGPHITQSGSTTDLAAAANRQLTALSISPNGRFLAGIQGRSVSIYDLANAAELISSQVSDGAPDSIAGWLPDSSAVLLNGLSGGSAAIWQVSLYGEQARLPLDGWQAAAPAPGGRAYLALVRPEGWGAAVYDLSSGALVSEYAPEAPASGNVQPAAVTWLPDGRLVAVFSLVTRSGERSIMELAMLDPASGAAVPLDTAGLTLNQVAWSASGTPVAYTLTSGSLWLASELGTDGTLLVPLRAGDADGLEFSLSPAGETLIYQNLFESGTSPTLIDLIGGETTRLVPPDNDSVWHYRWLEGDTLLLATDNASEALVNQPTSESFWLLEAPTGAQTRLLALDSTIFRAYTVNPDGCALPPG